MGIRRIIKNYIYKSKYKISKNDLSTISELNYLITGANSGIGLALTKEVLSQKNKVFATFRKENKNLLEIKDKNLHVLQCDQENEAEINKVGEDLREKEINVIINCAAIADPNDQKFGAIDYKFFLKMLMINSLSISKFTEVVLKYSKKNSLKLVLNISSSMGSIKLNNQANSYMYRVSKSTLNAVTKNMSIDLKRRFNVCSFALCPGMIKTKMLPTGLVSPELCSKKILNLINGFDDSLNGKFVDLSKKEIPW
jgi:short-subunit dehydrogenase